MNKVKCHVTRRDRRVIMGNEGVESETDSSSEGSLETDGAEERGLLGTEKYEEIKERPYIHGPSDNEVETVERLKKKIKSLTKIIEGQKK